MSRNPGLLVLRFSLDASVLAMILAFMTFSKGISGDISKPASSSEERKQAFTWFGRRRRFPACG